MWTTAMILRPQLFPQNPSLLLPPSRGKSHSKTHYPNNSHRSPAANSARSGRSSKTQIQTLTQSHVGQNSGLLFRQKLLYLERHLNVDSSKALAKNPDLRSASLDSLKSVEKCLYSFGIDRSDMGRILSMHPQLLTCSPDSHLYPVFDFLLHEASIPFHDLRKSITRCPRLLVSSVPFQLRPTLYFLRRLGFVGSHAITCQTTLLLVSSVEATLIPKLQYLQSLGFSFHEAVRMVLRSPGLFTFSIHNNFRPKVDYFLNEMKGDLKELRNFPHYFSFSLEGRIKPRHQLLLQHGFSMRLPEMLKVTNGEFNDRLVEMRLHILDEKLPSSL